MLAFREIESILERVGAKVEYKTISDAEFNNKSKALNKYVENDECHVILVCLRTINEFVYKLLIAQKFPYAMQKKKNGKLAIRDLTVPSLTLSSPMDQKDKKNEDLCVVAKINKPGINNNGKIFIIAGMHAIGTLGGAKYLTTGKNFLNLCNSVGKDNFVVITKCEFEDPEKITMVKELMAARNLSDTRKECHSKSI